MAGSEIRGGRKYLIFDDPKLQAYYDALFNMGNPDSNAYFDVNSAADLARVGIIDPAEPSKESAVFPMRFDMNKIDSDQKIETVPDGYNRSELIEVLNYYSPEEKQAYEKLKSTDPERWAEERAKKEEFACEGHLRRNIRRMMEGHVVLMDEKKTEYPRSLRVEDSKSGLSGKIMDIASAPAEIPDEPEKPTLYGLISFFYDLFGWGKDTVEPYRRDLETYRKNVADLRERDTERRAAEKAWPEYAAQGKKVVQLPPDPIKIARFRVDAVSDVMRRSEKNITSVFGPEPKTFPGMKPDYEAVIESIDSTQIAKPAGGITAEQSAAFTHLAMMIPEISEDFMHSTTIFKNCKDHPAIHERDLQLFSCAAHTWDLQVGRDGLQIFTKDHPNGTIVAQAHKTAKQAYELWTGEKKDPSLMGKVLAESLVVFAHLLCRNERGVSAGYAATMHECESIYAMLKDHPELREAAIKEGLSEDVLNILETNHQINQQLRIGADAQRKLLSGKNISEEEKHELLADALLVEYIGNMLIEESKKVEKRVMDNMGDLDKPISDLIKRNDAEKREWDKRVENAANPEEKAALEAQVKEIEKKHFEMVTIEGSLASERLGSNQFKEPASNRYLAMGDPVKLKQIRDIIKDSRAVKMFADMPLKECVDTLAEIIGEDQSPIYRRLHVELSASIDKKVLDAPFQVSEQQPVNTAARQIENQPVVPGANI